MQSNNTNKTSYEVFGTAEMLSRHAKIVAKLRQGDFRDLEKLHSPTLKDRVIIAAVDNEEKQITVASDGVDSIRDNQKARTLLLPVRVEGKRGFLLVEELPKHNHDTAVFLKSTAWISLLSLSKEELLSVSGFEKITEASLKLSDFKEIPEDISFFGGQVYVLDDKQKVRTLPITINGVAGTGKSSILFQLHTQYLRDPKKSVGTSANTVLPGVIIARSAKLVNHYKKNLKATIAMRPLPAELPPYASQIWTLSELIREIYPDDYYYRDKNGNEIGKTIIGREEFCRWLPDYITKTDRLQKKDDAEILRNMKPEEVYEELRIIRGLSKKDYFTLANENSLVDKEKRSALWQCAEEYCTKQLNNTTFLDLDLYLPSEPTTPCFGRVLFDEGHNLSPATLKWASSLAVDEQFCVVHDGKQNYFSGTSLWHFTQALTHNNVLHLTKNYRCPLQVSQLQQRVLDLSHHIAHGVSHKGATTKIASAEEKSSSDVQSIVWHDGTLQSAIDSDKLKQHELASEQFVVIVHDEKEKQAAIDLFTGIRAAGVLTLYDSQGLQFHTVVLFHFFTPEKFAPLNRALAENPFDPAHVPTNRPKQGQYDRSLNLLFHHLHIAISRVGPQGKLILWDDPKKHPRELGNVMQALQSAMCESSQIAAPAPKPTAEGIRNLGEQLLESESGHVRKEALALINQANEMSAATSQGEAKETAPLKLETLPGKRKNKNKKSQVKQIPRLPTEQKQTSPLETKHEEAYEAQLKIICQKPDPLYALFSYSPPIERKTKLCLFFGILFASPRVFLNVFSDNIELIKSIRPEHLLPYTTDRHCLTDISCTLAAFAQRNSDDVARALTLLIQHNPALALPLSYTVDATFLFGLSRTAEKREALHLLLQGNPLLITHTPLTKIAKRAWLLFLSLGIKEISAFNIWQILIENNDFVASLSADDLVHFSLENRIQKISILFLLLTCNTRHGHGLAIISALWNKRQNLIKEAFCHPDAHQPINQGVFKNTNTTLIYLLLRHITKEAIFKIVLDLLNDRNFVKSLTPEELGLYYSAEDNDTRYPIFLLLQGETQEGRIARRLLCKTLRSLSFPDLAPEPHSLSAISSAPSLPSPQSTFSCTAVGVTDCKSTFFSSAESKHETSSPCETPSKGMAMSPEGISSERSTTPQP